MKWRGEKLEEGLEASRRERRICRKAVAMEKRKWIPEAPKWHYHLGRRTDGHCRRLMGKDGRVKDDIKSKVLASGKMLLPLIEAG